MRYGFGLQAAAAWIDAGVITKGSSYIAIDHDKIKRAQEELMKSASEKFSKFFSTAKID